MALLEAASGCGTIGRTPGAPIIGPHAAPRSSSMPRLSVAAASALLILLVLPASAQESVAITGIRMQAFLERSARWSEDLAVQKKPFKNLPQAGSDLGEPANAILVTLVFLGPKNSEGSRSIARDMAQVTVKQTAEIGRAHV